MQQQPLEGALPQLVASPKQLPAHAWRLPSHPENSTQQGACCGCCRFRQELREQGVRKLVQLLWLCLEVELLSHRAGCNGSEQRLQHVLHRTAV